MGSFQKLLSICLLPAMFLGFGASAATSFQGDVRFSEEDRATHLSGLKTIESEFISCLKADMKYHQDFFAKHGISPFYGDRSAFSKMSDDRKKQVIKSKGASPSLLKYMKPTSCVGLAMKCLETGFAKAGQSEIWAKVKQFTAQNDFDGSATQHALQKLGWKIYYWNPDLRQNEEWDATEKANDPNNKLRFWGYHSYRFATVKKSSSYYFNKVDDATTLTNFGARSPQWLSQAPMFIGTAHTGYHVFPGFKGHVIEAHSTRDIDDPQTVEEAMFNPLDEGGSPRGEYRSGLIAVPPAY